MRKLLFLLTISCFGFSQIVICQQITVDNTISAQQLIQNNLVQGCVEVTNITSSVNGLVNNLNSFGYFEQNDSSFPFQNGIIISTGDAFSAGNAENVNTLNEGEDSWGTDMDLETALGLSNTLNATSIEFEFTSISNLIQFNYILASEEYYGNFPCEYSDGFAFLIKPSGSPDPYTNIAVIPGTSIPVNTSTIHPEVVGFCDAENEPFFEGYNIGDTNFNGRTKVLSATATIIPNTPYQIKLIIADQTDENYDSAVFIEGNSFNATVDLGEDITTCAENVILNGDIQNPDATYAWYVNGTQIQDENNTTLTTSENGNYTVEVTIPLNDSTCIIEDSVLVTLSSEQTAEPISDYQLCDDTSGDETEFFDLSTKNNEVLSSVPSSNYNISYHYSANDADDNLNSITAPIQNSTNPQQIFVRIEDADNGCLAYTSFNLVVNALPEIVNPTPLDICDDEIDDGITVINLTNKNDEITSNQPNLNVSYHYTESDAIIGQNPIPSPYINSSSTETIYVHVENTQTGCSSTTSLTINVLENPRLPVDFIQMDACDGDHDGFASFNLSDAIAEITQGLTGMNTSIHLTYNDALSGNNPISDISSFENNVPDEQTLYVSVVNDATGCVSVASIELHTNLLLTGTQLNDFRACDDDSNDGSEPFNLVNIETDIINGLPDVNISFYLSQEDLDNDANAIDESVPFNNTTNPQQIYLKIENQTCVEQSQILLFVNPALLIQPIDPVEMCDTDDDGYTTINLSIFDEDVSNGNLDVTTVNYYSTLADAENDENSLPNFYTNQTNPQTIYTRITSTDTGCFDTTQFEITIIPAPTTTQPSGFTICDDNQDGMFFIDLDSKIPEIVSSTDDLVISFHTSLNNANNNIDAITDSSNYNASTQTIFVRVESSITSCFSVTTIPVRINTLPVFSEISNYQICESDEDQTAEFTFISKDSEILNGQSGKQVLYFETEQDANDRTNIINKNNIYQNTQSPQTIYVRVENVTDHDCYATSSFTIVVDPIPTYNAPLDWFVCDDVSNDGVEVFDLNDKINEISNGITQNLDITFYTSFNEADNSVNPIDLQFTNIDNPQQIFARIENGLSCYSIAEFGLNVIQAPDTNESVPLQVCDIDHDGIATFDLTISEFDILNVRQNEIEVTYFENEDDLETQSNQILDPENYNNTSNPQTIYIRVTNTLSHCFVSIPLELIVNLPPEINQVEDIAICEEESGIFDLSIANDLIVDDASNTTITYYNSLSDAQDNIDAISTMYAYTLNTNTIYVRVENSTTGCFITSSFNVVVNPNPIANIPNNLEVCDDDDDEIVDFNLSNNTSQILGNQNATNFTVIYFETLEDSESGENALNATDYLAYNEQVIYARVENNTTGCYSTTQFQTIVHPLPIIDIPERVTICLDDLPLSINANTNNIGDTYLWSTSETTPEIETTIIGDYWVTVITPFGCQSTKEFSVIESEQAMIDSIETIDFSDPNNITITVSGIGDYLYILDDGDPQESNLFEYVSLGYHTITIIDINGCNDVTKEVIVIDAPKFFTPNNDGYFDTWHISGVETLPGTIVYIFDRYGKLLKTLTHTSMGWDGTYNGNLMEVNDYWYLTKVVKNGKAFEVKGHFTLKR